MKQGSWGPITTEHDYDSLKDTSQEKTFLFRGDIGFLFNCTGAPDVNTHPELAVGSDSSRDGHFDPHRVGETGTRWGACGD